MKPIPKDTGSFLAIRTAKPQLLYVDKTAYLHRMITCPSRKCYFLARSRRFGKSLKITTLKQLLLFVVAGVALAASSGEWYEDELTAGFTPVSPDRAIIPARKGTLKVTLAPRGLTVIVR